MTEAGATKAADVAVVGSFTSWFFSHIAHINEVLQFILLIVSIIAACIAMRYHWRKTE